MSEVTIVSSTTIPQATGSARQAHVIYATNSGLWWLFYLSSTTVLATLHSSDGTTWTAGATFTLPKTAAEGGDFGVAYANISSTDVVHIVYTPPTGGGTAGFRNHIRATISGTTISFGSATQIDTTGDGEAGFDASVAITSSGHIADLPLRAGDAFGAIWPNIDSGTSWTAGTATETGLRTANAQTIFSCALVPTGSTTFLAVYDDGNSNGTYTTNASYGLQYDTYNGTSWGSDTALSGITATAESPNAWGVVARTTSDVHLVHRKGTNSYEHLRWNGTSWSAGSSIPTQTSKDSGGCALVSDGTNVWLFVIDSAAGNAVRYIKWNGSAWDAAWSTLESTSATRDFLSVCPQVTAGTIQVVWIEGSASPWSIRGEQLSTAVAAPVVWVPSLWPPLYVAPPKPAASPAPPYVLVTPPGYTFPAVAPPAGAVSLSPTMAGQGSLSVSLTVGLQSISMAGQGSLSVAPLTVQLQNVQLAGQGSLSVAPLTVQLQSVALSGVGALSVAPLTLQLQAIQLSGVGALSVAPLTVGLQSISLAGVGSLTVSPLTVQLQSISMAGAGSLGVASLTVGLQSITLAGVGALSVAPLTVQLQNVHLAGVGALSVTLTVGGNITLSPTFTGVGSLSVVLTVGLQSITLAGVGALSVAPLTVQLQSLVMAGVGSLSVAPLTLQLQSIALAGQGSLSVAPLTVQLQNVALAGVGSLAVTLTLGGSVSLSPTFAGQGALAVVLSVQLQSIALAGQGQLSVAVGVLAAVVASLAGQGKLSASLNVGLSPITLVGIGLLTAFVSVGSTASTGQATVILVALANGLMTLVAAAGGQATLVGLCSGSEPLASAANGRATLVGGAAGVQSLLG